MTKLYLLCRYSNNHDKILEVIGVFDSQKLAEDVMRSAFSDRPGVDIEVRILNRWYTDEAYSDKTSAWMERAKRRAARA